MMVVIAAEEENQDQYPYPIVSEPSAATVISAKDVANSAIAEAEKQYEYPNPVAVIKAAYITVISHNYTSQ